MKRLIVTLLCFILVSCSTNEPLLISDYSEIQSAREWLETNQSHVTLKKDVFFPYASLPDWRQAHFIDNGKSKLIEVPLVSEKESRASIDNGKTKFSVSHLLIHKKGDEYIASVMMLIPEKECVVKPDDLLLNRLSDFFNSYSGNIVFFKLNSQIEYCSYKVKNGILVSRSNNEFNNQAEGRSDCYNITTHYYSSICVDNYGCWDKYEYSSTSTYCVYVPDQPIQSDLPWEYIEATNGGGGSSQWIESDDAYGIDCASFRFTQTTSNWQESAVKNVGFIVRFIDPSNRANYSEEVKFTRPIWFGLPVTTYTNEAITQSQAAEIAASAVQYASDLTHILFIENPNTPISTAESVFMNFLKSKLLFYGGRADFYGSGSSQVNVTTATYNLFGNGDCN